jgi:tRNA A22 N-methylase
MKKKATREELEEHIRLANSIISPLDLAKLVAQRIITKNGEYYEVLDMKKFPEEARYQVKSIALCNGKFLVKFLNKKREREKIYKKFMIHNKFLKLTR